MQRQASALLVAVLVVALAVVWAGCAKKPLEPGAVSIAGPEGIGKVKPMEDPPAQTRPIWGMWSIESAKLVGPAPDYGNLDALVQAGITYVVLDAGSANHDIWQINAEMIARAKARGVDRVVGYLTTGMLEYARDTGDFSDIEHYIYHVNTDFFAIDEPKIHDIPIGVIEHVATYLDGLPTSVKGEERGLYIAAPVGVPGYPDEDYDSAYYSMAYRVMPDGYKLTLDQKRDVFIEVGPQKQIAPIVGLMYTPGGEGYAKYVHLKGDISTMYPYCKEIWFFTSVAHLPSGYDLFNPYENMDRLEDVIRSYPDIGWGDWEFQHYTYGGSTAHPVPADYNGDGRTDISVKCDDQRWLINYSDGGINEGLNNGWDYESDECGGPTAHPCPADYDGDGCVDMSVKCDDGRWLIMYYAQGEFHSGWNWESPPWTFGGADAHPVPADYDGDSYADLSVSCDDGSWKINYAADGFDDSWDWEGTGYGVVGGEPCPADYLGDGRADIAVKGSDGFWRIDYAYDGFNGWDFTYFPCGNETAHPAPADYDGDGITDIAVKWDDGKWSIEFSSSGFFGLWDWENHDFGGPGYIAVPADYDGDGIVDLSTKGDDGTWFINYVEPEFASHVGPGGLVIP